jgi:hypothetical protein
MDDMSQIPLHTVATFCEHTAEMLEGVSDNAELIKRHRASLERLRDGLARLRWIIAFPASERSFKLLR